MSFFIVLWAKLMKRYSYGNCRDYIRSIKSELIFFKMALSLSSETFPTFFCDAVQLHIKKY